MIQTKKEKEMIPTANISANQGKKSAKPQIYQPNWERNQPNRKYISQTGKEISQTTNISAKHPPTHKQKKDKAHQRLVFCSPKTIIPHSSTFSLPLSLANKSAD
ncbi:hypothetical protein [Bacillus sp. T2.9-1]|uniref:hypothetical protein n=1 Tax=Bacillus sp. T2.9-1 TaxID=3041163 RepID=UPI00254056B3|nr:hypothetical protein [Bacillus sp. T2.9-1]